MIILLKNPFKKENDINERVRSILNGDQKERNTLIHDYKPFIINIVSKEIGKFVNEGDCDELSIGLLAFNEAIDRFDEERSKSFLSFAERIIKSRLIDFYRKEKTNIDTIPLSYLKEILETEDIEEKLFADNSSTEALDIAEEMQDFVKSLLSFGITVDDLVDSCPKHSDSRRNAVRIASSIVHNDILMKKIMDSKNIPIAEVVRHFAVSRKIVHKNKKFILAVCLILLSNNDIIKSYVYDLLKEVD